MNIGIVLIFTFMFLAFLIFIFTFQKITFYILIFHFLGYDLNHLPLPLLFSFIVLAFYPNFILIKTLIIIFQLLAFHFTRFLITLFLLLMDVLSFKN